MKPVEDELLYCQQCERPFIFSAKDAERYERLGFDPPRRCQDCRKHKIKSALAEMGRKGKQKGKGAWEAAW